MAIMLVLLVAELLQLAVMLQLHPLTEQLEEQVQVLQDLVLQEKTVVHIIIFLVVAVAEVKLLKAQHQDLEQPLLVV
tara:strand:+ start:288 stop:518 length:231 start_codon:yes stop_codon:yes gene_type:complete